MKKLICKLFKHKLCGKAKRRLYCFLHGFEKPGFYQCLRCKQQIDVGV